MLRYTLLFGTALAFAPVPPRMTTTRLYAEMTQLERDMDRAVQCAEHYELCNVEELNQLADGKC